MLKPEASIGISSLLAASLTHSVYLHVIRQMQLSHGIDTKVNTLRKVRLFIIKYVYFFLNVYTVHLAITYCSFNMNTLSVCALLYCIVLYCIVCIALYCIVLYCIVLHCIALHCIALALHCIALHCIALYCIVLYYEALY